MISGPGSSRWCRVLTGCVGVRSGAIAKSLKASFTGTVIPEPSDQIGHRKRRGSRGGRPVNFDSETYKGRNTVERSFSLFKQWRGIATRYDKLALTYRAGHRPLRRCHLVTPTRRHALAAPWRQTLCSTSNYLEPSPYPGVSAGRPADTLRAPGNTSATRKLDNMACPS
jgi:putative transposase